MWPEELPAACKIAPVTSELRDLDAVQYVKLQVCRIVTMTLVQTAWWGVVFSDGVGSRRCRGPARRACRDDPWRFTAGVVSFCAPAAGWVQMRCRECAAEVAATGRVCSGCGAPITGQPPVVADTVVADTLVAAIGDAAREAVPVVAGKTLPDPYVPGSGDRVPAELRLVLAGHVGLAAAVFATGFAWAAVVFTFSSTSTTWTTIRPCCWSDWPLWSVFCWGRRGGRSSCSRRVSGFRGCSGGPAIHTRPR